MAEKRYADFDLSISCDDDTFYAKVIDSPAGSTTRQRIPAPFENLGPVELILRLENAVLSSIGDRRGRSSRGEAILKDFGRRVFNVIFRETPEIAAQFRSSISLIANDPMYEGLRVKLRIDSPELTQWPWEYVYDESKKNYLCLRERSPLVRFLEVNEPSSQLEVEGTLNILGMIANPGGEWTSLDTERERKIIDDAIAPLQEEGKVNFRWVPGETVDHLFDAIQKGTWHVFHFIGHGGVYEYDEDEPMTGPPGERDTGFIVLSDGSGGSLEISASSLKNILQGRSLRLVVLNCCEGARGEKKDAFSSTGASLVRSGIPAVVAMQFPISNLAATQFANGFYKSLAKNDCLEKAITSARVRMSVSSNMEWGIPVLFTRIPSGRLFTVRPTSAGNDSATVPRSLPPREVAADPEPSAQEDARQRLRELFHGSF